jgi:hypothetical protein
MSLRLPNGQSLYPFLINAADLHCAVEIRQTRNNRDQATGSHTSEISIPFNQDRIRAIARSRNGCPDAAGTAAHHNYVAFSDYI